MVFELVTLSHYTANINLGRIAALLAYCYRLCRTYVDTYLGSKSLLTFLGMIAGWLFKVFLRTRVYDWLDKQGGWVRMCTNTRKNERERERGDLLICCLYLMLKSCGGVLLLEGRYNVQSTNGSTVLSLHHLASHWSVQATYKASYSEMYY